MRTLKEIIGNPKDSTHLTGLNLLSAACSYYPNREIKERAYSVISELESLANAPAPDVNAALMANEECQEILAEVKAQNGVLLDALQRIAFSHLAHYSRDIAREALAKAETSQRPTHAELRGFFAEDSSQPLTAREEMERETA